MPAPIIAAGDPHALEARVEDLDVHADALATR